MFFHLLFLTLIYDGSHYVWKDTELVEKAHFDAKIEGFLYLALIQLKDQGHSFKRVTHKLR
jgi:hypothetical protein